MKSKIEETKKGILHWMAEYTEDDDEPSYTLADVSECDEILTNIISAVCESPDKENYESNIAQVKNLALDLNDFNEKHCHEIIETDQREGICELIVLVIESTGHACDGDITEEWRKW